MMRSSLNARQEAKLRLAYGLAEDEALPRPFGDNPFAGDADPNESVASLCGIGQAVFDFELKEISARALLGRGDLAVVAVKNEVNGDRVASEWSDGQGNSSASPLQVCGTLSRGRASSVHLIKMCNGRLVVLKLFHKTEIGSLQFERESQAYASLGRQGLLLPPTTTGGEHECATNDLDQRQLEAIAPHCFGWLNLDHLASATQTPQGLITAIKQSSRGILIDYLRPQQGWTTLEAPHGSAQSHALHPTRLCREACQAAIEALQCTPRCHGDVYGRNVLVRSKPILRTHQAQHESACASTTFRRDAEAQWQAVWVDWASSPSMSHIYAAHANPDAERRAVSLHAKAKRKELALLWSRLFEVMNERGLSRWSAGGAPIWIVTTLLHSFAFTVMPFTYSRGAAERQPGTKLGYTYMAKSHHAAQRSWERQGPS
ncbi:hypothetical protein IE81DRAFT_364543 [Ceraceosorus guamensis]|uniref:Protein kinase domain-containing protein n=1 Tax=Ceraceosorus guamensis TaxID=1522189 RepID=A0A316W4N9_9BASI|nr:hypothetical protein IE81DRAFT_364543 [Ceraceosorus guamensis]PWN44840.1 hypothetical protein IE81DRAFT_364543 [Ceraceosorus guamensis]